MPDAYTIDDAGYLRPKRRDDSPLERIRTMMAEVASLVAEHKPDVAVIEITSGQAGRGSRAGAGPHLAVYGMAVGAIWAELVHRMPEDCVCTTTEREWTRGVTKAKRRRQIGYAFPAYRDAAAADSGGDVADAIGLGVWWFGQKRRNAETSKTEMETQECARKL